MKDKKKLLDWYYQNQRNLPWRQTKDPYQIWISEVMLQQTTVKAVVPYYEKFLNRFPTLDTLAKSTIEEVYEFWSGLGYYSRARNLHKAAKALVKNGFPKTHQELLNYPGFGPYTARAVASFAFKDSTGVLDGNVIRFLSRYHGLAIRWWENSERKKLQTLADHWVTDSDSSQMNQALIEIGATICTPKSPSCLLCPLKENCQGFKKKMLAELPLKKPRKKIEIWIWEPHIFLKNKKIALALNAYAPFLKGQLIFPGRVKKSKTPPKVYHYKHTITHHEIYVKLKKQKTSRNSPKDQWQWVDINQIKKVSPVSLIQKALPHIVL